MKELKKAHVAVTTTAYRFITNDTQSISVELLTIVDGKVVKTETVYDADLPNITMARLARDLRARSLRGEAL